MPHDSVSNFGTVDCITVCTDVVNSSGKVGVAAIGARVMTIIGIDAAARRTLAANVAKR